jgi:hypothetical protein
MKYLILAIFGAGIVLGSAVYINRAKLVPMTASEPRVESAVMAEPGAAAGVERASFHPTESPHLAKEPTTSESRPPVVATTGSAKMSTVAVNQAVDQLVSPHSNIQQKRSVWQQLKEEGGLDQAIGELERRTAANGGGAEYPSTLGQAYLQKCGTISDVREQGILAMQADKLFDTALGLDPANWEARYTKAVALSYWPASMGKGEEVVQHFLTLVQQQETQPSQPQFAETYVLLGEQYQKSARNDDARAVWERGSALFPDNEKLRGKLSAP